jgi:hypothetical protein
LEVDQVPVSLFSLNRDLLGTPSLLACTARQLWTSVDLTGRTTPELAATVFQRRLVKAVSRQMTPPFMVLDELSARFGGEWEPWLFLAMRIAQPVPGFPSGPARLRPVPSPKEISAPLDLHIVDHGTHLAFDLTGWPDFVPPHTVDRLVRMLAGAGTAPESVAGSAGRELPDAPGHAPTAVPAWPCRPPRPGRLPGTSLCPAVGWQQDLLDSG